MIGVVVVAHGSLAKALVEAAEFIVGHRLEGIRCVGVEAGFEPEEFKACLKEATEAVDAAKGVIVLTDMFGGSPSDMSISFLEPGRVEVLTGVNLPMLLHIALRRSRSDETSLEELAEEARKKAIDSIAQASRLLNR